MLRTPSISLPIPEPLALLDATLLFIIQVLLARHPELLTSPDAPEPRTPPAGLRPARRIFDAVRELHHALDSYRIFLPEDPLAPEDAVSHITDDDIPF